MSANIININERRKGENKVPEETLDLPQDAYEGKAYDANWQDDIVDEAEDEIEEETSFEPYENEQDYQSKEIVSREAENLIYAFDRAKKREFGRKVLDLDVFKEIA